MVSSRMDVCPRCAHLSCSKENWYTHDIRSCTEIIPFVEDLLTVMAGAGYPETDRFGTRLALEEAVINALRHGNRGDPGKLVHIRYRVEADNVCIEVEDEGDGFDPSLVPDPRASENLEKPSGRGLFLMRHYASWFNYNDRGNCVTFCRQHS